MKVLLHFSSFSLALSRNLLFSSLSPNGNANALRNPALCSSSCFIFTWMESNTDKGWRVLWIIFSHWIIFTRTTRLIDRIAVLCSILGSLFSGAWLGLHGRPGQSAGPFVAFDDQQSCQQLPRIKKKKPLSSWCIQYHDYFDFSEVDKTLCIPVIVSHGHSAVVLPDAHSSYDCD